MVDSGGFVRARVCSFVCVHGLIRAFLNRFRVGNKARNQGCMAHLCGVVVLIKWSYKNEFVRVCL